jgi:hypothetical protein
MQAHFDCISADDAPEQLRVSEQVLTPSIPGLPAQDENAASPSFSSLTHEVKE